MSALFIAFAPFLGGVAAFVLAAIPLDVDARPLAWGRDRWHVLLIYLFHLRYQLLITIVLLGLPGWGWLVAGKVGNWMEVEAADVFLMVWVAELAAVSAVYAWWLALVGLPQRQGLPPLEAAPAALRLLEAPGRLLRRPMGFTGPSVDRAALGAATAAGLYYGATAVLAQPDGRAKRIEVWLVASGIALLLWVLFYRLAPHVRSLILGLVAQLDSGLPRGRRFRAWLRGLVGPGFGLAEDTGTTGPLAGTAVVASAVPVLAVAAPRRKVRVLDHGWMFARILLGVLIYATLYFSFAPGGEGVLDGCRPVALTAWHVCFPAVAYVLLLGTILGLLLCFLAFLFDYVRAPVMLILMLLLFLSFSGSALDHYYPVTARAAPGIPAPGLDLPTLLNARRSTSAVRGAGGRLVVVATAGGGITAAGWTATVLGGLDEVTQGVFGDRLAAVSSVSGGSLGSALYIDDFLQRPPASGGWQGRRTRLFDQTTANSLRSASWGLVFPDLLRLFRPAFAILERVDGPQARIQDRSWAMEQNWRQRLAGDRPAGWSSPSLVEVGRAAAEGRTPVPIINAMLVENGAPYALTPLALPQALRAVRSDAPCPFISIAAALPERDLDILTAARLSATFPYVTPMSRAVDLPAVLKSGSLSAPPHAPGSCGEQAARAHVGDGGYFDNFGVAALSAWLDDAFTGGDLPADLQILWLNVYWEEPETVTFNPLSGVEVASQGPFRGLVNARGSTQRTRNRAALEALSEKWNRPACVGCPAGDRLQVQDLVLGESLPLNWQLGERDKDLITGHWSEILAAAAEIDGPSLSACPNAADAWDTDFGGGEQVLDPGIHQLPDEGPDIQATKDRIRQQNGVALRAVHAFLCLPADGPDARP